LDDQTISGLYCSLAGEDVWLLPERALFWKRAATLIIADPHVGKPGAFRAAAIAAPEGTTIADLERLSTAIRRCGAQRLIVLGDLLHARSGRTAATMSAFEEWAHPSQQSRHCAGARQSRYARRRPAALLAGDVR
jgi:metallophosphoesterase superfamily enzyme